MIYASATDHINKHPYLVMLPPHVQSIHETVLRGKIFAPIYESNDSNLMQRSNITIAKMVELTISNTTFTILEDYDVLQILHQIDAYVDEVYPLRGNPEVLSYLDRILKLRQRIYTLFRRVLNRRPQWKAVYSQGHGIFEQILKLYRPLGISIDTPQAHLEALAICPTVRANPDQFTDPSAPKNNLLDGRIRYGV